MQIESLKVFCDLAETESFTKAAQINNVTQSAVSQQISSLERQFKSLLIERSKKKFRLTREGQVLYEYSKQIIQTYDSLHNRLQEIKDIISGTIRVATIYSIGLHDLPPYLKKFLKLYPTVNVHVEYRRANQVYEDVLSNVVDLGLVAYPIARHQAGNGPVAQGHAGADLPSAASAGQDTESSNYPSWPAQKFISFEPDIPTRKAIDKILKDHDVEVQTVMEFDNIETVKRAVEIDAGVSHRAAGHDHPGSGQADPGGSENRGRGTLPPAGRHLQKEQGPLPGHEAVPPHFEGLNHRRRSRRGQTVALPISWTRAPEEVERGWADATPDTP